MPSVLILAGGVGERFWPVSTTDRPKQFLPLTGNLPMILETVYRVRDLVGLEKTYIITTEAQLPLARRILTELPAENIIVEPEGRNTAPCLILSLTHIQRKQGRDEVIAVLPSDHFIGDDDNFRQTLSTAFAAAAGSKEIVTFGIKPDRPETGYGYIAVGDEITPGIYRGVKFVEKPDEPKARRYLEDGYLWNSGMFVFRSDVLVGLLKKNSPKLYKGYLKLEKAREGKNIAEVYRQMPKTSIDFGIMEKLSSFLVIPGAFGWDDLGTWRSLEAIHPKDEQGNISIGNTELIDVSNSVIYARDKLVAAIGLKDLVIVESRDATLVCHKDRLAEIREIADRLKTTRQMD